MACRPLTAGVGVGVPVIHASGRPDCVTAPELQHLLDGQLAARPWAIVLGLGSLSVLDPGGVQTLDYLARRAGKADIGLGLVTVDGAVIRTLVTAGYTICSRSTPVSRRPGVTWADAPPVVAAAQTAPAASQLTGAHCAWRRQDDGGWRMALRPVDPWCTISEWPGILR